MGNWGVKVIRGIIPREGFRNWRPRQRPGVMMAMTRTQKPVPLGVGGMPPGREMPRKGMPLGGGGMPLGGGMPREGMPRKRMPLGVGMPLRIEMPPSGMPSSSRMIQIPPGMGMPPDREMPWDEASQEARIIQQWCAW